MQQERASLIVRSKISNIHQSGNQKVRIAFTEQKLSSYSGLELFKKYFDQIGLYSDLKRAFSGLSFTGDFTPTDIVLCFISLWLCGGRRLKHIEHLHGDASVERVSGLKELPSDRTLSRVLKQLVKVKIEGLIDLAAGLALKKFQGLGLKTITLDFDGTVLSTGNEVTFAARGYNPHKRFSKSYYPILCHIAQTGHFLLVRNRPGNVHDSRYAVSFIKAVITQVREALPGIKIEVRLDSAFFQYDIIKLLNKERVTYAIKVPMWKWTNIKSLINGINYWHHKDDLSWRKKEMFLKGWNMNLPVIVYRQKLSEKKVKNPKQLDLFSPDDGLYEYSVVLTNSNLCGGNVFQFYNGRSNMEHNIAELKQEFAFDVIPTKEYSANTAYQVISLLAYNLVRNFQIDAMSPEKRDQRIRHTHCMRMQSLKTIRFTIIAKAGRIVNQSGVQVLKMQKNDTTEEIYNSILHELEIAA